MNGYRHGGKTSQHKASLYRRRDARALRDAKRWRGTTYLLGYAIECTLKARLMERYNVQHLDGLEGKLSSRFKKDIDLRTHSIAYLFEFAEAGHRLTGNDRSAYNNCVRWRVDWRYDPNGGNEDDCDAFFQSTELFLRFIQANV